MEFVPDSYIKNKYGKELDVNSPENIFWEKLGIETCNFEKWCNNCRGIISCAFGSTYTKKLLGVRNFNTLQYKLDNLVCTSYPIDVKYIQCESGKDIKITNIFSVNHTIKEYQYTQSKKKLTLQDYIYIKELTNRMSIYLDYLNTNFKTFPVFNKNFNYKIRVMLYKNKKEIVSMIKKIKVKINKISTLFLHNITVEIDYNALKNKIKPFKEELIQRCLHPIRLSYYLHTYNYDIGAECYCDKDDWRL